MDDTFNPLLDCVMGDVVGGTGVRDPDEQVTSPDSEPRD
jgi:hypothetical protein